MGSRTVASEIRCQKCLWVERIWASGMLLRLRNVEPGDVELYIRMCSDPVRWRSSVGRCRARG
jgi:hypothetical protein